MWLKTKDLDAPRVIDSCAGLNSLSKNAVLGNITNCCDRDHNVLLVCGRNIGLEHPQVNKCYP